MTVLVSQPVHQHSYETVRAAQECGVLRAFATGIYDTGRGLFAPRWRAPLPSRARERVDAQLARRRSPHIDPARVDARPGAHLAAFALRPVAGDRANAAVEDFAHRWFDRAVAHALTRDPDPPKVVHAFEGTALATLRAARARGATAVLDVPIAYEHARDATLAEDPSARGHGRFGARHLARLRAERDAADVLLVPSDFVRDTLDAAGVPGHKMRLVPYGVDVERFRPAAGERPPGPFRALYVGQIAARKGVRLLLEAWAGLPEDFGELTIIGGADAFGRALLDRHAGRHRYLGQVAKHEVHEHMAGADAFVFPSLAEGSALVTYEAMALGLPVITTPNSGSVVRDGQEGLIVPPSDVAAIQAALRRLRDDPGLRTALGDRARTRIETGYTWSHYRARMCELYRALLAG